MECICCILSFVGWFVFAGYIIIFAYNYLGQQRFTFITFMCCALVKRQKFPKIFYQELFHSFGSPFRVSWLHSCLHIFFFCCYCAVDVHVIRVSSCSFYIISLFYSHSVGFDFHSSTQINTNVLSEYNLSQSLLPSTIHIVLHCIALHGCAFILFSLFCYNVLLSFFTRSI